MLFPGLALLLTVLAFNLVGDALQDALTPRARKRRLTAEACVNVQDSTTERNARCPSAETAPDHPRSIALVRRRASPRAAATTTATSVSGDDFAPGDRGARRRGEGRHARGDLGRRRSTTSTPAPRTTSSPTCSPTPTHRGADGRGRRPTTSEPQPRPRRRASPRSRRTARRSPSRSATASCSARRSTARSPRPTSSTRSSARSCRASRTPTRPSYLGPIEGFDEALEAVEAGRDRRARHQRRSRRPTTRRSSSSSPRPTARSLVQALSLPAQRSGARGVREGVRRREPVDVRRAPGRDRART